MKVLVLAAGKGKRLQSEAFQLPKVLRELNSKPLIDYVLKTIPFINPIDIIIIIGFRGEDVIKKIGERYTYVWQKEQLGTGHAVLMAKDYFEKDNSFLILLGDMPFIKQSTIQSLISSHNSNKSKLTLLTAQVKLPSSFGRIIRNSVGNMCKIVEVKDASEEEKHINEVNTGIMVVSGEVLELLPLLKNNNLQNEYYLTDLISLCFERNIPMETVSCLDEMEVFGINTVEDLDFAEKYLNSNYL